MVVNAAEKANRVDRIGFMTGTMGEQRITDTGELLKIIESARDAGDEYYLVSLPRDKTGIETITKFAEEIIPSFR